MTIDDLFELIYEWDEQNINAEELYQKILILFDVSKWVKCVDRLPEFTMPCLVNKGGSSIHMAYFSTLDNSFYIYKTRHLLEGVKYWKYMPKPPVC